MEEAEVRRRVEQAASRRAREERERGSESEPSKSSELAVPAEATAAEQQPMEEVEHQPQDESIACESESGLAVEQAASRRAREERERGSESERERGSESEPSKSSELAVPAEAEAAAAEQLPMEVLVGSEQSKPSEPSKSCEPAVAAEAASEEQQPMEEVQIQRPSHAGLLIPVQVPPPEKPHGVSSKTYTDFINLPMNDPDCHRVDADSGLHVICAICDNKPTVNVRVGRPFTLYCWSEHKKNKAHVNARKRKQSNEALRLRKKQKGGGELTELEKAELKSVRLM